MYLFKTLSISIMVIALVSIGTWAGWSARARADILLDAQTCTEKAIDTLIFWK